MRALVTVGSTQFDELVRVALSERTLSALRAKKFTQLTVQLGKYIVSSEFGEADLDGTWHFTKAGVDIEAWRYKPSLKEPLEAADLVISHAGSGTILEVLRMSKPVIVVPNPTLLDNHQVDLATELDKLGYLKVGNPKSLVKDIETFDQHNIQTFPAMDRNKFRNLLDEEMGYI